MKTKKCPKCKQIKQFENFHKNKASSDGLQPHCKDCKKIYKGQNKKQTNKNAKIWRLKNLERCRAKDIEYGKNNPEKIKQQNKNWYNANREQSLKNSKDWRQKNPDKVKKHNKEWYKENKEKKLAQDKIHYKNNREYYKKKHREWQKKNPEKVRERARKRRDKKLAISEHYTTQDEQITLQEFNHQCFNCGSTDRLEIDHHLCLNNDNALTLENAVVLCKSCNCSKGQKDPKNFYNKAKLKKLEDKLTKIGIKYKI